MISFPTSIDSCTEKSSRELWLETMKTFSILAVGMMQKHNVLDCTKTTQLPRNMVNRRNRSIFRGTY